VTVTRPGGSEQRAVNQSSIDTLGLYRQSLELPLADDDQAASAAEWRASTYGVPQVRCQRLQVDLVTTATETLRGSFSAADIGTLVRVTGLPSNAPDDQVDVFVEGYSERIAVDEWRITWNTSPGGAWPVWTLEDPVLGQIDNPNIRIAY
jgi:hypothetical protein